MNPPETTRLCFRDFESSDFEAVHEYASDEETTRFMWWGPNSVEMTRDFLSEAVRSRSLAHHMGRELAILERQSGRLIGGISLVLRRPQHREYELGYCINRSYWGRGLGAEAGRAMLALGFDELEAHRIFASVDPENIASVRLLERLGFRREGHQIRDSLIRGEWRDSYVFALLQHEWGAGLHELDESHDGHTRIR